MSDTTAETPRNDTGQFETSEPAYGREGLERAAGYVPLDTATEETPDDLTVREAAEKRLKELSGSESGIVTHTAGLPANVTMTLDQAADALADTRGADDAQAEIDGTKAAQKEIDKLRGEKPAAPSIESEADIEKVLANPKVQAAITERVTAADTQRAQYEAAVADAGKFAAASLFNDLPELADMPPGQWAHAINEMHERDPARARLALSRLQAVARVEAANQQIKAQKTAREQTEFKAYAAKENARFAELTRGIPAKEMAAIQAHVPKMLAEHGADVRQFLEAVSNQTTFPRASAEALLVKAARYDLMRVAAKAVAKHNIPPVQKPGIAGARGAERADASLAALSAKLSKSGSLKDAVALRLARSKGK
ncbi:hypothetical protein [Bradyrhizobium sp. Bra78]|uniref:hypothetical protein n=1 Tax=Bradyrhizobium sp. Bra78 TaxID=2926010 RepID=UPI0021C954F1|nr:hypothetical protein [Bradyrhizobium sp. Bra78]